jgi:hypothetical protein
MSLWFYPKTSIYDKNMPKIHIWSPWGLYSSSVRHYSVVHDFLRFWKISIFGSKLKGVSLWFNEKMFVHYANWPEICNSSPWGSYSCLIRHYSVVYNFFEVFKNIDLRLKTQSGYPLVLLTNICLRQKLAENPISSSWGPYYCLVKHYGPVHTFFKFWKISSYDSKSNGRG